MWIEYTLSNWLQTGSSYQLPSLVCDKGVCVTCLSVSKDAGVVAQEGIVKQTLPEALENYILTWGRKHTLKPHTTEKNITTL